MSDRKAIDIVISSKGMSTKALVEFLRTTTDNELNDLQQLAKFLNTWVILEKERRAK
jgi:hypothetical protein